MKQCFPVLFLWLLAAAVWTGFITANSAVNSVSVTVVPKSNTSKNTPDSSTQEQQTATTQESGHTAACVSLNSADTKELISLPRIGPVIAKRIITYRSEKGGFTTISELDNVKGIGPATMKKLKGLLCL